MPILILSEGIGPIAGATEGFLEIADGFSSGTADERATNEATAAAFNKCLGEYVNDVVNQALLQTCTNAINVQQTNYLRAAKQLIETVNKKDFNFADERGIIVSFAVVADVKRLRCTIVSNLALSYVLLVSTFSACYSFQILTT